MNVLTPSAGIQQKLEMDLEKQKEKAQKTAKSLVAASMRKRSAAEAKEQKKKKAKGSSKGQQPQEEDILQALEAQLQATTEELKSAEDAEKRDKEAQLAIEKALNDIKMPTAVPLTVMSSSHEGSGEDMSARATALQDALQKQKQQLQSRAAGQEVSVTAAVSSDSLMGLPALLANLRRSGTLTAKGGKKKSEKDKQQAVGDVLKLGGI